jgi:hypothetical protein
MVVNAIVPLFPGLAMNKAVLKGSDERQAESSEIKIKNKPRRSTRVLRGLWEM